MDERTERAGREGRGGHGGTAEAAAGLARIEGHLMARAEAQAARAAAEDFAARLPWLTGAQHDEVVRRYTEDRIALTRRNLEHIARRCRELAGEYDRRYAELRHRLLRRTVALALGATALCWFLLVLLVLSGAR